MVVSGTGAENDTATYEVTVAGRAFSVATLSSDKQGQSLTAFFHSPEGEW